MRVVAISVLIVLMSQPAANQEIDLTVDGWEVRPPGKMNMIQDIQRPFVGSFKFSAAPAPLEPVIVDYTLEVTDLHPKRLEGDWEIVVFHDRREVIFEGDSTIFWPGPHHPGDILTGKLQFTPLTSGRGGFLIYHTQVFSGGMWVYWCLDLDGRLTYLGNPEKNTPSRPLPSTFFRKDSVYIPRTYYYDSTTQIFDRSITVKPLLRIGDTSTIHYEFTAMEDLPNGVDMELYSSAMEILNMPARLKDHIAEGEVVKIDLQVVPKPVRDVQLVTLEFVRDDPVTKRHRFILSAIFDDEGRMRYFHYGAPYSYVPDSLLPSTFRPAGYSDGMEITVPTSGPTTRYRRWLK